MKRSLVVAVCALAFASFGWAQTATRSGHAEMRAQHPDNRETMCKQMMGQHVAELRATAQTLTTNLAQMKSTLPMLNDVNERSRWQSNIAMWQAVAEHFNKMAKHAEHMQGMGMGCGMMMGHSMGEHSDHEPTQPATPSKPQ